LAAFEDNHENPKIAKNPCQENLASFGNLGDLRGFVNLRNSANWLRKLLSMRAGFASMTCRPRGVILKCPRLVLSISPALAR